MPIEKAFSIRANPHEIYSALERDLATSADYEGTTFRVIHRNPGRSLRLAVTISGMPCTLEYTIFPRGDESEVVATLEPYGLRYLAFRVMTLGLHNGGFDAALVQGLANLKESVEGRAAEDDDGDEEGEQARFPDEADRLVSAPDE